MSFKVPMNFRDAERHVASLSMSVLESVVQAGQDPSMLLAGLDEAERFAHVLAKFCGNLRDGAAAEIAVVSDDDTEDQTALRREVARKTTASVTSLMPLIRVSGRDRLAAELAGFNPEPAA